MCLVEGNDYWSHGPKDVTQLQFLGKPAWMAPGHDGLSLSSTFASRCFWNTQIAVHVESTAAVLTVCTGCLGPGPEDEHHVRTQRLGRGCSWTLEEDRKQHAESAVTFGEMNQASEAPASGRR